MEASTTIYKMLAGIKIYVPSFQQAYTWETEFNIEKPPKQINKFWNYLENRFERKSKAKDYFGHFLFDEESENDFRIHDGHQRITTIAIFLLALFIHLKTLRDLTKEEEFLFKSMYNDNPNYSFSVINFEKQLFGDYVTYNILRYRNGYCSNNGRLFIDAFDFFYNLISSKSEPDLSILLRILCESQCTTHVFTSEFDTMSLVDFPNIFFDK